MIQVCITVLKFCGLHHWRILQGKLTSIKDRIIFCCDNCLDMDIQFHFFLIHRPYFTVKCFWSLEKLNMICITKDKSSPEQLWRNIRSSYLFMDFPTFLALCISKWSTLTGTMEDSILCRNLIICFLQTDACTLRFTTSGNGFLGMHACS